MKKQFLIVTTYVANLREKPVEASFDYSHDDLQKTQLLYNETLLWNEERADWCNVEAIEQKKAASGGSWCGYPGWVKKDSLLYLDELPEFNAVVGKHRTTIIAGPEDEKTCLLLVPIGTRLTIEDRGHNEYYKTIFSDGREGWVSKKAVNRADMVTGMQQLRKDIVATAKSFLGMPYLWGGRSAYLPMDRGKREEERVSQPRTLNFEAGTGLPVVTGVDCSGLVSLAYRVYNVNIPRDACDQWSASTPIPYDALDLADLIFLSAEGAHDNITHVMLYTGGDEFIEASKTGSIVTTSTFEKRFGTRLQDIAAKGSIVDKKKIFFASIIKTGDKKWAP